MANSHGQSCSGGLYTGSAGSVDAMGRADSVLRDRVIFVEGAPRSGTSWLVNLLATHPEIAGVEAESHLFDFGADRLLDNFDGRDPANRGLLGYLERDELIDLIRDLCDGILVAMRSHVSAGATPPFVVEKTPIAAGMDGLDLERKLECYPDAWYVHIVRDREAVARSLMRAPWIADRSYKVCVGLWDRTVGDARRILGELPRYREVSYEALKSDPVGACAALFAWLEVGAGDRVMEAVRVLSRDQYSDLGAVEAVAAPGARPGVRSRLASRAQGALARRKNGSESDAAPGDPGAPLAFTFVVALRSNDVQTLRSLTAPSLELVCRSAGGDQSLRGEEALAALARIGEAMFTRHYVREWWASAGGGPGEWWTSAPGKPFWTVFFSGLRGDATRVDVAIGLALEDALVGRVVVVSAGPLAGRPVLAESGELEPGEVA